MSELAEPLSGREAGAVEEAAWSILGGLLARHPELTLAEDHGPEGKADLVRVLGPDGAELLALDRRRKLLLPSTPDGRTELALRGGSHDFVAHLASSRRLGAALDAAELLAGLAPAQADLVPRHHTLAVLALLVARTRGPLGWLELRQVGCRTDRPCVPPAALHALTDALELARPARAQAYLALRIVTPWGPDPRGPIGFLAPDGQLLVRLGKPGVADLWADGVVDPRDAVAQAARSLSLDSR